jgi:hypothetical protein
MIKSEDMTYSISTSGNVPANGSSSGSAGTTTPQTITWPNVNGQNLAGSQVTNLPTGSTGSVGLLNSNGQPYITSHITASSIIPKKGVKYVIVQKGGSKLELVEQQTISPREMIGICKFINAVSMATTQASTTKMRWSDLIQNLKIEKHFQPMSNQDSDYHYIYLNDPT